MSDQNHESKPLDLDAFERELAGVSLPELNVNRDELMYQAGFEAALKQAGLAGDIQPEVSVHDRASVIKSDAKWKVSTLVLAATAAVLAIALFVRPDGGSVERFASVGDQRETEDLSDDQANIDRETVPDSQRPTTTESPEARPGQPVSRRFQLGWLLFGPKVDPPSDPLALVRDPNVSISSSMLRNQLAYRSGPTRHAKQADEFSPDVNQTSTTNYQLMRELIELAE